MIQTPRMPMEIKYGTRFRKNYKEADRHIKTAFEQTLELFFYQQDPSLRNHALRGKFVGYRSINVTDDVRAIFKVTQTGKKTIIIFHMLGTHEQLYKK